MIHPQKYNRIRRGNALILVVGILVLLVLVATAFITKTQSGRATAVAQRDSARITDRADTIHREIADEIAIALFPRTLASTFEASANSANARRVAPSLDTPRYGLDPLYPFNFAPYEVVPWTNPPDDSTINGIPPLGPDNPLGGPSFGDSRWLRDTEPQRADVVDLIGQGVGSWSFADGTPETFTHWRHLTNLSRSGNAWRIVKDISNITGNGQLSFVPPVVSNLDIPVEQWPVRRPQRVDSGYWQGTGMSEQGGFPMYPALLPEITGGSDNFNLWQQWNTIDGWAAAQVDLKLLPQNFLDLSDLDGDGIHNEESNGERPSDAFISGSNRWHTERWITDTDGDGFTDALWHLIPQTLGPDTKQIVAVSITDNSALGNVNVATQFQRSDYYNSADYHGEATKGHTPADLALVGQNDHWGAYSWRVGFMDNIANSPGNTLMNGQEWISYYQIGTNNGVEVDWDTDQWRESVHVSLLDELGIEVDEDYENPAFNDTTNNLNPTDDIYSRYGRLWYWQLAGRKPFEATDGFSPFTRSDEMELRIAEGNNYQAVASRFERSINEIVSGNDKQFLRSHYATRHEASEYRDQLDNRQLLFDNRRKLTMFSGARNDLLPPWLRWEDRFYNRHDPEALNLPMGYNAFDIAEYEANGVPAAIRPAVYGSTFPMKISIEGINAAIANGQEGLETVVRNWREQSRTKLDLREYYPGDFLFPDPNEEYWWESNTDGRLSFAERLPLQLLLAMTDGQEQGVSSIDGTGQDANAPLGTYSTPDPDGAWDAIDTNYYQQARLAAAGLASNIMTYRDEDSAWRQHSVLPYTYNSSERKKDLPLSQAVSPPVIGRQSNDGIDPVWGTYVPFADAHVAGPTQPTVEMLGLEAQPFILEAFIAHAHEAKDGGKHWACCLETGGCEDVSKDTCEGLLGGTFFDGSFCDPNGDGNLDDSPCPEQGACCLDTGGCIYTSQMECDEMEGTYQGDAVSCIDDPCFGACCVDGTEQSGDGECIDVSASTCGELGAAFAGFGTECISTACTPLGSCCFASASCMDTLSEFQCNSLGGIFELGVFCATDPCELGACCLSLDYGACVEVSQETCQADLGGTYIGTGVLCISEPCVNVGACCMPSGSCIDVMSGAACLADGGTFTGGASCIDGSTLTSTSSPIADTWIRESTPTTALGTQTSVVIGEEAASNRAHLLIDFDIDDTIEAGNVVDATVILDYEQFLGVNSTVTIARLAQTWDEVTATWNAHDGVTAWPGGAGAFGDADETIEVETFTVGTSGDVKIHVEQFVQDAILNRDGSLSLIMYKTIPDGSQSNTQFASRETNTGTAPTLTIQYVVGVSPCASACCLSVDVCETVSQDTCETLGGTFTSGVDCAAGACEGACCFATGGCEVLSQESCESQFSATYSGPGTSCSVEECGIEGACCLEYTPDEIWLNELLYDNSPVWVNEFQYDSVDAIWLNELHYDTFIDPWVNEFQYDTVDLAWLNELHYDNAGADVNEFVEIALDSYIDPTTVDVLLYNGADGTLYNTLDVETFDVGAVQGGKTLYSLVLPVDGLQDGPDGVAIVIGGVVEQFVSYEGTFFATDGAANTLKSVDYGISETGLSPAGTSIGLDGTGSNYADFSPTAFNPDTRGAINAGQQIDEGELIEIALDTEINPATTTVVVSLYNGADGTVYNTIDVSTFAAGNTTAGHTLYTTLTTLQDGSDGIAITVSGVLKQFISYEGAFLATDGPATGAVSENVPVTQTNASATASLGLTGSGSEYSDFTWSALDPRTVGVVNTGQTIEPFDEFIEIALDSYIEPTDAQVLLYDGADGTIYSTIGVNTFVVGEEQNGKIMYSLEITGDGLQDGPDGIALTVDGAVEQFVSYEGTFTATDGAASGLTSVDYGIAEENVASGTSIGLQGNGSDYADYSPVQFGTDTQSQVNAGQQINDNELIEIALDTEIDPLVTTVEVLLYDGSDGTVYETLDVSTFAGGSTQTDMKLYFTFTTLRNGDDGIAISIDGVVKQFISYEGSFVATDGAAVGLTSENIPVSQSGAPATASLGLTGAAPQYSEFNWTTFDPRTPGFFNTGQTVTAYTEFIEIAVSTNVGINDVTVELYSSVGALYDTVLGNEFVLGETQGGMNIYSVSRSEDFLDNGPAALAVLRDGDVVGVGLDRQFISYEGVVTATDGAAVGMTSSLIPIPLNNAVVGTSIGLVGAGSYYSDFGWSEFSTNSMGDINAGQTIDLLEESEVCIEVSETACGLLDGDFQGKAVSCGSVPCGAEIIRGSCCFNTGECEDIDSATCHELEGDYQGDGVSCLDVPCVAEGACCLESTSCLDLDQESCENLAGLFFVGEECSNSPCNGACCLPDGACTDALNQTDCESSSGTYRVGTFCEFVPCIGACCIAPATCDVISESTCERVFGGTFEGFGTVCTTDPCAFGVAGACCVEGGSGCAEVLEDACTALGGIYSGDATTCQTVACLNNTILGACCLPDTTCVDVVSQKTCDSLGGAYQGDTTSCADNLCTGACCLTSGSCVDGSEAECDALAGTFMGNGTACSTTPCRSACCLDSGSCIDVKMMPSCDNYGGFFIGYGSVCSTNPCAGACCTSPVGCEVVSTLSCTNMGGSFHGIGTSCVEDSCVEGSCCLDSGTCLETTQTACEDLLFGTFMVGASCTSDPCLGACCLWAGGCELLSIDTCNSLWDPDRTFTWEEDDQPGFFNGFGTACGPGACEPTGSCCLPSGSCVDIMDVENFETSPDGFVYYCEEIMGGKYRFGESCSDTECASACCLPSGCENLPEDTCTAVGGDFMGGFLCEDSPCELGTCCFDSGSCLELTEDSCEDYFGGTWTVGANCDGPDGDPNTGDEPCIGYFIVTDDVTECPQETVAVVQLANPFDKEIELNDYTVELFGQEYSFAGTNLVLAPSTPENPTTVMLYSLPVTSTIEDPLAVHDFNTDWIDFLDLDAADHPANSLFVQVNDLGEVWSTDRTYYDGLTAGEQNSIALYKFDGDEGVNRQRVLVDRIDPPDTTDSFDKRVVETFDKEWVKVGEDGYVTVTDANDDRIEAIPDTTAMLVQWDRVTRAWGADIPDIMRYGETTWQNEQIDAWEQNPRYVFAANDAIRSEDIRKVTNPDTSPPTSDIFYTSGFQWSDITEPLDPDDLDGDGNPDTGDDDLLPDNPDPWFTVEVWSPRGGLFRPSSGVEGEVQGGMRLRKPTYFDMNYQEDALYQDQGIRSFADKGWYSQRQDEDGDKSTSDTPAFIDETGGGAKGDEPNDFIEFGEVDMSLAFPMQMLQKDSDFEQVGEVLNCWLFGHLLEGVHNKVDDDTYLVLPLGPLDEDGSSSVDAGTVVTFSEFMYPRWGTEEDWWTPWVASIVNDEVVLSEGVNRLRFMPTGDTATPLMMGGRSQLDDFLAPTARNYPWPRLPIASRVIDSFVCDGPGRPDFNLDGVGDDLNPTGAWWQYPATHSFYNANGFSGKATPGIININTAPVEVLRMLPHMFKVVHETDLLDSPTVDVLDRNPRSLVPESMVQWREGANGFSNPLDGTGFTGGPDYSDRSAMVGMTYGVGPKHTRGFSSPSEIGLLQGYGVEDDIFEPWHSRDTHNAVRDSAAWKIDFARLDPFNYRDSTDNDNSISSLVGEYVGAPISTEVNHNTYYGENTIVGDGVSGDAEEKNLLQAGISNLIGTTSDIFTVHFRVRTFKRNPITGIWDATDLDYIVDDSRYVMLVDRSNVETPADKPKILYFEKLPN